MEVTPLSEQCRIPDGILHDRFRIIKSLGKGGMGEILLAEDTRLKRNVAIKSICRESLADPDSRARFLREAQTASRLDHPNICTVYEIAEEDGREYIIMQYVDGVSLSQLLKFKPLGIGKIVDIAVQISDGMMEAHAKKIIHRDLKPANIMIDRNGKIRILDFGLAKFRPEGHRKRSPADDIERKELTEKGIVMGTIHYMSPEQARGLELDERSDIFSFGVVLYEMVEGSTPFTDNENIATLYNLLHKDPVFDREIPEPLKALIRKLLAKDRKRRYAHFAEVKEDLERFRMLYNHPDKAAGEMGTQKIDPEEQRLMLEEIDRMHHVSDREDLGQMVRRLKRLKASTQAVRSVRSWKKWKIIAPVVFVMVALAAGMVLSPKKGPAVPPLKTETYILLNRFLNQTPDKELPDKILLLLQESLNQFDEFRVIDEKTARDIISIPEDRAIDIPSLKKKYPIRYTITGKLTHIEDKYNIEAHFQPLEGNPPPPPFFIPGKGRDSLLTDQIDNLSRRVYLSVFPDRPEEKLRLRKTSSMFGTDWGAFDLFFQGKNLWDRKEFTDAREYLLKAEKSAPSLPIGKYYLALLFDFTGPRIESLNRINQLIPVIGTFSEPLRFRVLALKAKLDFSIRDQIAVWQKLKGKFPFSKEVFYQTGEAYFRCGDSVKAIPEFKAALDLDPAYTNALNHMGYCHSYLGLHRQAIEYFEKYSDLDRTANSYDSLGDGYFYKGDYIQAENNKIYAIRMNARMEWPYLTVADIHILRANFREALRALKTYENLIRDRKSKSDALAKRAFILSENREYVGALRTVQRALDGYDSAEITDNTAEYHWLKGLILLALNRLGAATAEERWLRTVNEKYRINPENFDPVYKFWLHLKAMIAEREKRPEEADRTFRDLLKMKTQLSFWITYYNYPYFVTEYARFLFRQKRFGDASAQCGVCLEFNPDYTPALWVKASLLARNQNPQYRAILLKIGEIYGESAEANYWRNQLREKP